MKKKFGFTLIEVLIVVLLISIISTVAVLTIGSNQQKQLENFANKIKQLIILAEQEAMLRPATLGVAFTEDEMQFYILASDSKTWSEIQEKPFQTRNIPKNISATVSINGENKKFTGEPQIAVFSNLSTTPFLITLTLENHETSYKITGDNTGNIIAEAASEDD